MDTWLYQPNPQDWSLGLFRYEIWEGKRWHWDRGNKCERADPQVGDTMAGCPPALQYEAAKTVLAQKYALRGLGGVTLECKKPQRLI
jgi:hypothetical protein